MEMFDFAFVSQHLALFFAWGSPPFTLISRDEFADNFLNSGTTYCSPALVAALLSVASRLWDHSPGRRDETYKYRGTLFAHEAYRLLDIQPGAD